MDAIFKKLGKMYFGTCADSGTLNQASNAAVIKADFGQVTPENRYIIRATFESHGCWRTESVENGTQSKLRRGSSILQDWMLLWTGQRRTIS
jgi:hypothetical protein